MELSAEQVNYRHFSEAAKIDMADVSLQEETRSEVSGVCRN